MIYLKKPTFPVWAKFNYTDKNRYEMQGDGVSAKFAKGDNLPHYNHVEMAGFNTSDIISYRVDKDLKLKLYRFCIFPECRINPNVTQSSLGYEAKSITLKTNAEQTVEKVYFDGMLHFTLIAGDLVIEHALTASRDKKALVEKYIITNNGTADQVVKVNINQEIKKIAGIFTPDKKEHILYTTVSMLSKHIHDGEKIVVNAGEMKSVYVSSGIDKLNAVEIEDQFDKRKRFLADIKAKLVVKTPDEQINLMADMCKVRASESIFETKNGLMHAPGGGNYYAALWTNDQCEYVNPLFGYLGYDKGEEESLNCYRLYKHLVKEDEAVWTSIVACGDGYWHGAGDRGDTSMYLYGLTRYLMTTGDRETAREFLPELARGIKYVESQISADNVVKSDSDELENRLESGNYNLSTQVLSIDAFLSLSYLYADLGMLDESEHCKATYDRLIKGLREYYPANVEGYETYRYCDKEDKLRSWICLPLVIDEKGRAEGTIDALFSDKLSKGTGILSKSGTKIYWDRSALYALRGIFYTGYADRALDMLENYTNLRLLKEHVPYPVEAFPEGNAAHLSAESGLYLRIFVEGVIGYRPTGFETFTLRPNLPTKWDYFDIESITLCGKNTDINVVRKGDGFIVKVFDKEYTCSAGEDITIRV